MLRRSIGTKFLESMIDVRVSNPHVFVDLVIDTIKKLSSKFIIDKDICQTRTTSLSKQFFGDFNTVELLVVPKKNKYSGTCIVGKGVCYDTGGLNLKLRQNGDMFFDRNGALLSIASSLDHGVVSNTYFTFNKIGSNTILPGTIISKDKHKILIDDTDAEGRILLADGLLNLQSNKNINKIITIATLTGSAVSMTGERTFAMVHSNQHKIDYPKLLNNTLKGMEYWIAPAHKDYEHAHDTKIKGATACNSGNYRGAGSSTAFSFLKRFTTKHLLHLDIAAMMTTKDGNGLVWGLKEVKSLLDL